MRIDPELCIKCGLCQPYCPMDCIEEAETAMHIRAADCVECGICRRSAGCPVGAIEQDYLTMPRAVRRAFSDPFGKHENTALKHMGRGTEEIKTNDVTGIVHSLNRVAVAVEVGRPGVGAYFRDIETITRALSPFNLAFEPNNPVTAYIVDHAAGLIEPTILDEKILSGIIEFGLPLADLPAVLTALRAVETRVNTVFTVAVITLVDAANRPAAAEILTELGYSFNTASAKTNVGLGRPRYEERVRGRAR